MTLGVAGNLTVERAGDAERAAVNAYLEAQGTALVVRRGELLDARQVPALIARRDGEVAGVLSYVLRHRELEVLVLWTTERHKGVGTALLTAVEGIARDAGVERTWLVTTNDNVDALRFYQRRGFRLVSVDPGAVDRSRGTLKPAIPVVGDYGIPLRDELILERP